MKRIATIGAVITAFAIAPSIASAGNLAQAKPQFKAQVISAQVTNAQVTNAQVTNAQVTNAQVTNAQVTNAQRAQVAVAVRRHRVQIAQAQRWAILRAQLR